MTDEMRFCVRVCACIETGHVEKGATTLKRGKTQRQLLIPAAVAFVVLA